MAFYELEPLAKLLVAPSRLTLPQCRRWSLRNDRGIQGLNAAGFEELRVPHMAVLQFPGPDGVRPGTLAERAAMSKQAMNQLLAALNVSVISSAPTCQTRAAHELSTSPSADTRHIQESMNYFARSSASGMLSLGLKTSLSSNYCFAGSGRAR